MNDNLFEYVWNKYKSSFPNIKRFCVVSNKTGKGIEQLSQAIMQVAFEEKCIYLFSCNLRSAMGERVPERFLAFEDAIHSLTAELSPPIADWGLLKVIGKQCNIKEEDIPNAGKVIGSMISFSNNPQIENVIVLDMKWIIDLIMKALMSPLIVDGKLSHTNLNNIWENERFPPHLYSVYLQMLETLEILHDFPNEGYCLIPFLFPQKSPETFKQVWADAVEYDEFLFNRLFLFDFLPMGFFTRLTLHMMSVAHVSYYWRDGMILQTENEQVLLECINLDQIAISFRGNGKTKKLARLVLESLDNFLSVGIKANLRYSVRCTVVVHRQVMIPCSHCVGLTKSISNAFMFDISVLEEAVAKGENYLYCHDQTPVRIGTHACGATH